MSRTQPALRRAVFSNFAALLLSLGLVGAVTAQTIETVAGTSSLPAGAPRSVSLQPTSVAIAPNGGVYIADPAHSQILWLDAQGTQLVAIAGTSVAGFSGDGGLALNAQLNYPNAVAVDATGNLFIGDTGNGRVRKIDAVSGVISTIAGGGWITMDGDFAVNSRLMDPRAMTVAADGTLYIVEQDGARIRRVVPASGRMYAVAGNGSMGSSGDNG